MQITHHLEEYIIDNYLQKNKIEYICFLISYMDSILLIELIGVPVIFLLGSLFHFLYKYAGKRKWMAVISPVNESIWEHLKIAFYPALIYSIIQLAITNNLPANYFTAEIIGIYFMIFFILIAEWIYPAILKRNVLVLDLLVFFVAILGSQLVSYAVFNSSIKIEDWLLIIIAITQTIIFAVFSFKPPKINLLRDSVDGKYGIK